MFPLEKRALQPCPGGMEELLEADGFLRRTAIPLLRKTSGTQSLTARLAARRQAGDLSHGADKLTVRSMKKTPQAGAGGVL